MQNNMNEIFTKIKTMFIEWIKDMVPVIWSAFKDLLRNVLIAVVPVAIDRVANLNLDPVFLVGIIAALKYIDALLHKYGKVTGNDSLKRGLARF